MLQQAMVLAESPLLPEETASAWLDEVRFIHNQDVRKGLIAAANKVASLPCRSAERWARLALDGDPLDESAWHALVQNLEASGHHADGLQAYDHCRKIFAAELGCAPGPRLQGLYARLLRRAYEGGDDLSQLLDAVIRLHVASRSGLGHHVTDLGGAGRDTRASSVELACHTLNQLLRTVKGLQP